jgi:lysophospholipase L1-like esterase
MKCLVIGDSHTRDLKQYFEFVRPGTDTFIVSKGSKTPEVIELYRSNLYDISCFNPEVCYIHLGHNDMAQHPIFNPIPAYPKAIAAMTVDFAREVAINFPMSKVIISATLPRTATSTSYMSDECTAKHNKNTKRHGQRLRHDARVYNIQVALNNQFWLKISKALEDSKMHDIDGLHLNAKGKVFLIRSWIGELDPVPT